MNRFLEASLHADQRILADSKDPNEFNETYGCIHKNFKLHPSKNPKSKSAEKTYTSKINFILLFF